MSCDTEIQRSSHSRFNLRYHLILAVKYRRKAITDGVCQTIREAAQEFLSARGCELLALNHDRDHVHIMFSTPPTVCLATLVGSLKTVTSRKVRSTHAVWLRRFFWRPVFWSLSYYIGTVGDTTAEITELYIDHQGKK